MREKKQPKQINVQTSEQSDALNVLSVEEDKQLKRDNARMIFSFVWTLLSVVYAIIATGYLIAQHWVADEMTYALIIVLVAFILLVVTLVAIGISKPSTLKNGKKGLKIIKFVVKLFKALITLLYLVLAAMTLASVAVSDVNGVSAWVIFILTFVFAVVKLILVFVNFFAPKIVKHHFGKNAYSRTTYLNGEEQSEKNKRTNKLLKKLTEWSMPKDDD